MSRYAASIGVWKHTIYGMNDEEIKHNIIPEEQDNMKFIEIKDKAAKAKDEQMLNKGVGDLYFDMITRSDNTFTEEEKKDLRNLISINIAKIINDMLIAYKWTTQKKIDDMEKRQLDIQEEVTKKKMMAQLDIEEKTS